MIFYTVIDYVADRSCFLMEIRFCGRALVFHCCEEVYDGIHGNEQNSKRNDSPS